MTALAVSAEIARLDALSRTRAIDDRESRQLEKLLNTQRRKHPQALRPRAAVDRAGRPYTVAARDGIIVRIDAALAVLDQAGRGVRAIYLTGADLADAIASGRLATGPVTVRRRPSEGLTYAGHAVREAKGGTSMIYDRVGWPVTIRQRLDARR